MKLLFDEARAYLYISDNFGGNIDLKPKQAMELLDFLRKNAEDISGYILEDDAEEELAALARIDQHLAGDEEATNE